MKRRDRKSARLRGYDYSGPGDYFVTVCTHKRQCILGEIVDMCFCPSKLGMIVRQCWEAIPEHFPRVQVGVFQIMPNHIHGIVSIRPDVKSVGTRHGASADGTADGIASVGAGHVQPLQKGPGKSRPAQFQHVTPGSLGSIVRSFKAAVTKAARESLEISRQPLWQRNFHDHIIRDDISYFLTEQYIELNPLYWHLDIENPHAIDDENSIEELRNILVNQMHFDHRAIEYLIQNEIDYRVWRNQG